ncbi:MAG TPA: 3-hydroxyacyl-CoA dehydrogenase/enoyl-CoA hydratase family protein [Fibrobacteria bacterium]|nr:3-hydroxyacyl-CoA dehydrogenase/enoyl-CoA hydratase family protein [Fibrobacteria bacterium]
MQPIRTATVVGSGIMGSQIAAHLAGCGIPVLLLDIVPKEGGKNRNLIADKAKDGLRKVKPSPFYNAEALDLITTGNIEDHLAEAGKTDWILEAIVEQPGPKQDLFKRLQAHMGPHTILATNTSGIPLKLLGQGLSESVQERFIGTHFFNPPRYLRLVEVIKGPLTSADTVARINHVLGSVLNKVAVPALDSPAFIANRIGVHAMVATLTLAKEMGLTVEEVDGLTGPLLGRPKTATFKLADLVGLDTLVHIVKGLQQAFPKEIFSVDPLLEEMVKNGATGRKGGAGFYKKGKSGVGGSSKDDMEVIDLKTGQYRPEAKARFEELKAVSKEEVLEKKMRLLFAAEGRGADAARRILCTTLAYSAQVAPTITEDLSYVDEAMELGFAWEAGPFKVIDAIGPDTFKEACAKYKIECPAWIFQNAGDTNKVYKLADNRITIKDVPKAGVSGQSRHELKPRGFSLALHRIGNKPVIETTDATLWDIGDKVLLLEFHSKMNSMGPISLDMILKSVDKAANGYAGLVIGNQGSTFCAGANIAMVLLDAANGEYDNIDFAIKQFQRASMAIKYASVPVIVTPHNMALGGGCEFVLHSNRPVLSPETYMGLVEVGVGLLPAGAGTKEMTLRALDRNAPGQPLNRLIKNFELIAMGKVSTSAKEAFDMGYLDRRAVIASNESTRLDQAKAEVLAMSRAGYRPPAPAKHIEVLGTESLAAFETGIFMMREGGYASEHDALIGLTVGHIMSGGRVTPGTVVDEDYLLDLEREGFLKLVGTKKSQERIEHMLKKGKPLRN